MSRPDHIRTGGKAEQTSPTGGEDRLPRRVVSNQLLLGEYTRMLREGLEVSLLIKGNSMYPFLVSNRDEVLLKEAKDPLKEGDILLFRRQDGDYVLHRLIRIRKHVFPEESAQTAESPGQHRDPDSQTAESPAQNRNPAEPAQGQMTGPRDPSGYYFTGDAQTLIEGPLRREQIIGIVLSVRRKGRWYSPGDFWWNFFEGPWRFLIPLRHPIITVYSRVRKVIRIR